MKTNRFWMVQLVMIGLLAGALTAAETNKSAGTQPVASVPALTPGGKAPSLPKSGKEKTVADKNSSAAQKTAAGQASLAAIPSAPRANAQPAGQGGAAEEAWFGGSGSGGGAPLGSTIRSYGEEYLRFETYKQWSE